jgi:GTP-binding protein HflX
MPLLLPLLKTTPTLLITAALLLLGSVLPLAAQVPQILVFNKLDAMDPAKLPHVLLDAMELDGLSVPRIYVSAQTGQGMGDLRQLLAERVLAQTTRQTPETPGESPAFESPVP